MMKFIKIIYLLIFMWKIDCYLGFVAVLIVSDIFCKLFLGDLAEEKFLGFSRSCLVLLLGVGLVLALSQDQIKQQLTSIYIFLQSIRPQKMPQCCKLSLSQLFIYRSPPLQAHQSPISNTILLVIRIFSLLFLTSNYIYDFTQSTSNLKYFYFVTNCGYFFTWLFFLVVVQDRIIKNVKGLDYASELLFQVAFCAEVVITFAYWLVLFPGSPDIASFNNISHHGIPLLLLLCDFIFNSYRFFRSQYLAYAMFICIYMFCINMPYSLTVTPVYGHSSDWVGWRSYVMVVVSFLIGALVHLIGWAVYNKLKYPKIESNLLVVLELNQSSNAQQVPQIVQGENITNQDMTLKASQIK